MRIENPSDFIRSEFNEKCLQQNKVAKKIGIVPSHLCEILNGKRRISAEIAIALESIINIDPEELLTMQLRWELKQIKLLKKGKQTRP
jgi:addiction module HigA family antidote